MNTFNPIRPTRRNNRLRGIRSSMKHQDTFNSNIDYCAAILDNASTDGELNEKGLVAYL